MKKIISLLALLLSITPAFATGVDEKINQIFGDYTGWFVKLIFATIPFGSVEVPWVLIVLVCSAVFFTIYFKFINIRGFMTSVNIVRGKYDDLEKGGKVEVSNNVSTDAEGDNPDTIRVENHEGEVSHFQALTAALSATVGLGNIAGVAVAISIGGPGATFWMIVAGLIGMSSKFVECTLGVKYREIGDDGTVYGGPMYYLSKGLKEFKAGTLGKVLAVLFAIMCIGGSFGGGNMFQSNQAFTMFESINLNAIENSGPMINKYAKVQSDLINDATFNTVGTTFSTQKKDDNVLFSNANYSFSVTAKKVIKDSILGGLATTAASVTLPADFVKSNIAVTEGQNFLVSAVNNDKTVTLTSAKSDRKHIVSAENFKAEFKANGLFGKGWIFGLVMAILVGIVIIGGIKSIAKVTDKIVPFMVGIYVLAALVILGMNFSAIPAAFGSIFSGAFASEGIVGGAIGVLIQGFRRAAFSNEAGIGSASIAHSAVKTKYAASEGLVALLEPFIDTVIVCTMTALVIIITNSDGSIMSYGQEVGDGVTATSAAFASEISWFPWVLAAAVILFAFSTMISWSYYGYQAWTYLFGRSKIAEYVYKGMFCLFVIVGAAASLGAVIDFSDAMIFAMMVPNMVGLFFLAPRVRDELKKYMAVIKPK
jgi:Na+/alanine symporter